MKKIISISVLLLITLVIVIAAGPFQALGAMEKAIDNGDLVALERPVNFVLLRTNVKARLKERINIADDNQSALAVLAAGFANAMVDGIVNSMLTPEGFVSTMKGERVSYTRRGSSSVGEVEVEEIPVRELFKDARYGYDSINQFSVWVKGNGEDETRLILTREGLGWRLTDMELPLGDQLPQ